MDEEALFAAALECPTPEKRRAFLQGACAGDAKLQCLRSVLFGAPMSGIGGIEIFEAEAFAAVYAEVVG